jgi:hypothetical protein
MTIVCITPQLSGWAVDVDREAELWFEADYAVDDGYALMIYPKACWQPVYFLNVE